MRRIFAVLGLAACVGVLAAAPAGATNGMDMIGYGTRAIGMGGADVAVDGDAAAVSGNPAVVSKAAPSSANVGLTALMPELTYRDDFQKVDGEGQVFLMPQLGYVHALANSPWSLGLGVYAQGGMGVDFQNVMIGMDPASGAPITDEMTSEVAFLRVNPLASYRVNDDLSLGASLMLGYAMAKFSMFPETVEGVKVEDLTSYGFAAKFGAQYRIGPQWRIGATYTTQSVIDLDGGTATVNMGPLGKVEYDAALDDFTWPQEVELGVAWLPAKGVTIAADVKWINWSATIDKPVLKLSNPNAALPAAYQSLEQEFDMGWDDQWVYAIGAEWAVNEVHTLRCGFNFGNNPVPDEKLNPLFPAIPTTHLTVGYGANFGNGKWSVDLAYEHAFEESQDGTNPEMAPGFGIDHSQNTLSAGLTYRY